LERRVSGRALGLAGALAAALSLSAEARSPLTADEALTISRAAVGTLLPDLVLLDDGGRPLPLSSFRGRPLLVNLVYTACSDVCPTIIDSLHPAVETAQEALGRDSFAIATVGFDVRHDTPTRMRSFARERGADLPNWHFLSGTTETVGALSRAVGFSFYPSAGGFDHMAQVSVIDGQGRVHSQIYGGVFEPPAIVEPLKNLVLGRERSIWSGQGLVDRVRLICTVYDPNTGRYYFNYALFMGIGAGGGSLLLVLAFLLREWWRARPGPT
jgi:protein SCO1/2